MKKPSLPPRHAALPPGRRQRGLSLVELMVAMALGLILVIGVASVYLFSKTAFARQSQISTLQQSVRTAFEYLGSDARMVGHQGCATRSTTPLKNDLSTASVAENFGLGIEGYEYDNATPNAYTLTSDAPADDTSASGWAANNLAAPPAIAALPITDLGSALTPGSDVLVIRTVTGPPLRLTANTTTAGDTLSIEQSGSGTCSDGSAKFSGFCPGSYGLVASCAAARAFKVASIAAPTLTLETPLPGYEAFPSATAEVFPLQTVVYFVKRSSSGTTTSLYRRVFSGDPDVGTEQELLEDVESLQVLYGRDTTSEPDGTVDVYSTAENVTDWTRVVTVRMSLLIRSATPLAADTKVAASAPVNGVTMTFPSGSRYDRRVFTTTVALRNKIAYLPP